MQLSQYNSVSNDNKQVCSYLGGQLENYCIEFLAEYTDDIIDQLVNNYLNPEQVCQAIGACP